MSRSNPPRALRVGDLCTTINSRHNGLLVEIIRHRLREQSPWLIKRVDGQPFLDLSAPGSEHDVAWAMPRHLKRCIDDPGLDDIALLDDDIARVMGLL
jgi:hypothetical protein